MLSLLKKDKEKLFLICLFFLAFILRLIYLLQVRSNPYFLSPTTDALYHDMWARSLAQGHWIGNKVFFRAPFYPYLLGLVYVIFGHNYLIPRLIQHLLGSASCILVYFLAKELFDQRVAKLAGLGAALYGIFFYFEDQLLLDSFLIFFDVLLILSLLKAKDHPNFLRWSLCGAILGLSAITRPNILFFIPFVWLWIFVVYIKERRLKQILTWGSVFLAGSTLMILPVTLRNYLVEKDFVLIASQGGINFFIGNNRNADGMSAFVFKEDWQYRDIKHTAQKEAGRTLRPSEISSFYYKKGIRFLLEEPERAFKLWVKKLYLFWNKFEVSCNQNIYFFKRYSSLFGILPVGFWFVAPLGLTGMILSMMKRTNKANTRRCILLPVLFVFSYMLTVVMFFVTARLRLPVIPFLIIFSAFALVWFWEKLFARKFKKTAVFVLLCLPFFFFTNSNFYNLSVGNFFQTYFSLGNAYLNAGKLDLALEQYNKALTLDPLLPRVHLNKGIVFFRKQEYKLSEKEFLLELKNHPQEDRAYNNLSAVYLKLKLYDDAIRSARKAIELKPYYPEAYMNLALAYKAKHDYQKAKEAIASGLRNVRSFPEADFLLGEIYQTEGKPDSAIQAYRKILSAKPSFDIDYNLESLYFKKDYEEEFKKIKAKAYFNLATLMMQRGKMDLAESYLKSAIKLKPDFAEAYANLGTLYNTTARYSEALGQLQKAVSLDPQNPIYHYNLGLAYARNNLLEQAKQELRQSLKIEPHFEGAQDRLFLVDSLLKEKIQYHK